MGLGRKHSAQITCAMRYGIKIKFKRLYSSIYCRILFSHSTAVVQLLAPKSAKLPTRVESRPSVPSHPQEPAMESFPPSNQSRWAKHVLPRGWRG